MSYPRFYVIRRVGDEIVVMSMHVAEPTIEGYPEYTLPANLAEDAARSTGYKARDAEVISESELRSWEAGRDALRRLDQGDDSLWHDSAIAEIRDDVERTLTRLHDENGDAFAEFVLEEGDLGQQARYSASALEHAPSDEE